MMNHLGFNGSLTLRLEKGQILDEISSQALQAWATFQPKYQYEIYINKRWVSLNQVKNNTTDILKNYMHADLVSGDTSAAVY